MAAARRFAEHKAKLDLYQDVSIESLLLRGGKVDFYQEVSPEDLPRSISWRRIAPEASQEDLPRSISWRIPPAVSPEDLPHASRGGSSPYHLREDDLMEEGLP